MEARVRLVPKDPRETLVLKVPKDLREILALKAQQDHKDQEVRGQLVQLGELAQQDLKAQQDHKDQVELVPLGQLDHKAQAGTLGALAPRVLRGRGELWKLSTLDEGGRYECR